MSLVRCKDIIIVGLQPWDTEIGSNCKDIAIEFSKYNRVLYVNSPLDRITKLRRANESQVKRRVNILAGRSPNLELVSPNLWIYYPDVIIESINWIKVVSVFNILNKINNLRFSRSILKAVRMLGFSDFILFNDNDIFRSFYLKDYLNPELSIYYSRDNLLAVDYWQYHGSRLEPLLMAKSDICVANSRYLASICKNYNPNSYDVGQGCVIDQFSSVANDVTPEDLKQVPKPIIGYVGALQAIRLDIALLEYIAFQKPEWSIVLVGPEDSEFSRSRLHEMENVIFIGSRAPEQLPLYINSFDICINPQKVNEVTIGNYPRKIDEYLAVGKPVVATRTDSMLMFSEHVYLAVTNEEYIQLIEKALMEDTEDLHNLRRQFASTHTWENSVEKIYKSILGFSDNMVSDK